MVDSAKTHSSCAKVRALDGPGPFLGSRAVVVSPDGKNVYVAASKSDSIAVFKRNANKGTLSQAKGAAGCVAADGAEGCATAVGLDTPNSVAVSPDGEQRLRDLEDERLDHDLQPQPIHRRAQPGAGDRLPRDRVAARLPAGAGTARRRRGRRQPRRQQRLRRRLLRERGRDVRSQSHHRGADPAGRHGSGCIAETTSEGCAQGLALGAPEGLAISGDGEHVYAAGALSSSVVSLTRDTATGI